MSTESTNLQRIETLIANIDGKKNKILIAVPDTKGVPAASIYELYFHASVLKKAGHPVTMLVDDETVGVPDYIEKELTDVEHISMQSSKITVAPEDLLLIPEILTNVMEATKTLPCLRAVLFQSIDNATTALLPGYDWSAFGITNVITTSNNLAKFVGEFFGKDKFKVFVYNVSVPDYFVDHQDKTPKRLAISIVVRNERELDKIVKLFYTRFPQYKWINFEPMVTNSKPAKHLRRKDFAEKLSRNFAALWIDRISSHALFPLECLKVGTVPICYLPDVTPEYLLNEGQPIKDAGMWTDDFYQLPNMIADTLRMFMDDEFSDETYANMKAITAKYSPAVSSEQLTTIYEHLFAEKKAILVKTLETIKATEEAAK